MLIVFPIDLIKLNLLSVHVECVGQAKRYFQVSKTTEHVFAVISLFACWFQPYQPANNIFLSQSHNKSAPAELSLETNQRVYTISARACISSLVTMMFQKGAFLARHLHHIPKRRHQWPVLSLSLLYVAEPTVNGPWTNPVNGLYSTPSFRLKKCLYDVRLFFNKNIRFIKNIIK